MSYANNDSENVALENFLRYLRIPTVQPNVDYAPCVSFLRELADSIGLLFNVYCYYDDAPVILLSWIGTQPNLPSILLNSHMDVVPADETKWCRNPFAAEIDNQGNIYARGSQDTKSIGIQYLEAIRRLKSSGASPERSIHVSFVPDEEIGGEKGMKAFVQSEDFRKLNVGFALDEGTPSEDDEFLVSYGERIAHSVAFHCSGQTGHASLLLKDTAGQKLQRLLSQLYSVRAESENKIQGRLKVYGEHLTVNVTQIQGGNAPNVLPAEITLTVDCRLPPTISSERWDEILNTWCKEAGDGVWTEYLSKGIEAPVTKLDDSNKYWVAFRDAAKELDMNLVTWILPGGTDSRFLRSKGVPAIGFSPMRFTKFRLHEVDEHLNVKVFLEGIKMYTKLILAVASVL